jgi:hypothetical protein
VLVKEHALVIDEVDQLLKEIALMIQEADRFQTDVGPQHWGSLLDFQEEQITENKNRFVSNKSGKSIDWVGRERTNDSHRATNDRRIGVHSSSPMVFIRYNPLANFKYKGFIHEGHEVHEGV